MNIVLTGGGSAGHIIPLLRLKDNLKNENITFYYVGFNDSLESKIVKDVIFFGLDKKKGKFKKYIYSFYKKKLNLYFKNIKIDKVISTGGFNSYPMCEYARRNKIDLYLIEENAKKGLLVEVYKFFAKKTFTAFKINKKYIHSINPACFFVQKENIKEYDMTFIGGSLGSDVISSLALKLRNSGYKIALVTTRKELKYKKYENDNFKVLGFVDSLELFSKSNLVITRAGSSTIHELIKLNIPFIVIPSSKTKRNHQILNALYFHKRNLCVYFDEKKVNSNDIINVFKMDLSSIKLSQKEYLEMFDYDIYKKEILE